mmetsp:Transcript_24002/g.39588  ORF Transcript_24002/g.39588 Transcript_24002/m.39588 type:complete len:249 (-) Transcript_24002:134-880(-)
MTRSTFFLTPLLLLFASILHGVLSFTNEPPGRDPISIDKVRAAERAVSLTSDNFDELTKGKLVFIKFFSPHCPHCKEMGNAWNELADYYQQPDNNKNEDILIGSIDCTNSPAGKALCARFKIMGLPTILYGDANFGGVYLEEYRGDKTFADFQQFASKELVPKCNAGNLDACAADERVEIEYIAMGYRELEAKIKQVEQKEKETKVFYAAEFGKLQDKYNEHLAEKTSYVTRVKDDVRMIKEVIALKG